MNNADNDRSSIMCAYGSHLRCITKISSPNFSYWLAAFAFTLTEVDDELFELFRVTHGG